MRKLPLSDQLPYRFYPPKLRRFWVRISRYHIRSLMRREQGVQAVDMAGVAPLRALLDGGDGVLITPNHPDHADCGVIFELSQRLGRPFCYMAAHQIFTGMNRWFLPRLGVFPVDREGSDLSAFKTGVEVLAGGQFPLVVFPEGEIYHMADRLTPLREGAAALAVAAARRRNEAGRTVWIVPAAIKYRFLDGYDPRPALEALMADLEARFAWWPRTDQPMIARIYHYAEAMLALKELEYLGTAQTGPLKPRLAALRSSILDRMEDRHFGTRRDDSVPVRVKELRRKCLEALADPETTPQQALALRRDLNDLFVAIQLFSYPGDYIRECPTLERVAETLMKFEQDVLGADLPTILGPRRAILQVGEPIDVGARLASSGRRARGQAEVLTTELEERLQGLLDQIGPGRALDESPPGQAAGAIPEVGVVS